MNFINLCETFEAISSTKGKDGKKQKLEILKTFVKKCERGANFYNALRLFLPNWERERGPYRLREPTFTKTIINIFCLPTTGPDVNLLKNYNQSSSGIASKFKDYADAAYSVVRKKTMSKTQSYDLNKINEKLDEIAAGNIRKQESAIYDLFKTLSHLEIKWLIRILLRELKLGLGKSDILSTYHPDAPKYFTTNNSLKQLCDDLEDINKTVSDIEVTLFNSFRPMLSLRCDVKEFNRAVDNDKEFFVEEKFDGERFQVHFNQNKFKYFSRNGYDYTEEFRANAQAIKSSLDCVSVILDGEMMIFNKKTKTFGLKGMAADIKKVKEDSNIQQCFCVFDLVYLNGRNMCNTPLKERKLLLSKVINPIEGVLMVSPWKKTRLGSSKQEIIDELNLSMDNKLEGILFKSPDGFYLPNERIGWWKVKLEYFEGVMSDLDVLVLGGYFGQGATKGEITGYLVGVKDSSIEANSKTPTFLSFCKIATGLTREETKTLNKELSPFWSDTPQDKVILGKEKPDKYIKPSESKCLQVRGSELVKLYNSSSIKDYTTNYTLRFARILKLRLDKSYDDVLTTVELQKLTEGSSVVEKLNKRHLELDDLVQVTPKRKHKKVTEGFSRSAVDVLSDILLGYNFVVLSGKDTWCKDSVETAIRENGGTVAIECTDNTVCMLVGDDHIRTQIYKGNVDIVRVDWLRWVLNEGEFVMYKPSDVVYMSEKSRRKFMTEFDQFGDSYVDGADGKSLRIVFNNYVQSNKNVMHPTVDEINEFNREINLSRTLKDWKVLRGYVAYFDRYKIINDTTSTELSRLKGVGFLDRVEFQIAGGIVGQYLNEDCDCVIAAINRVEEVQVYLQSLRWDIPIYSSVEEFKQHILHQGQEIYT